MKVYRDSSDTISSHVGRITRGGRLRTVANANVARVPRSIPVSLRARGRSTIAITDVTGATYRDYPDRSIPCPLLRPSRGRRGDTPRRLTNNTPGGLLMRYPVGRIPTIHVTGSPPVFIAFSLRTRTGHVPVPPFPCFRARGIQDTLPRIHEERSRNLRLHAAYVC